MRRITTRVTHHFSTERVARRSCSMASLASTIDPLKEVPSNFSAFRTLFLLSTYKKLRESVCKYLPVPRSLLFN